MGAARSLLSSRATSSALVLTLLALSARAQAILFQDGFENGFTQWTATGLWNPVSSTQTCVTSLAGFPEGVTAAWYGNPATCDYQTGAVANSGRLELNSWIQLPSNVASVTLYFESWVNTEYCTNSVDRHDVQVIALNGPNAGFTEPLCQYPGPTSHDAIVVPWHSRRVDLTAYRGAQVRLAFEFRTIDWLINNTLGWLVDDVRIIAEPGFTYCPSAHAQSGCPCSSSLGWGGGCAHWGGASATLLSGGAASVAFDTLTFSAAHMPTGTTAVLFQGTAPITTISPFGDGLLCVGGGLARLGTATSPTGNLAWPLPGATPLSVAGFVPPAGGDRFYQVFFRESSGYCTNATFNLTSAQKVTWTP